MQYRASYEYECPKVINVAVLEIKDIWYGDSMDARMPSICKKGFLWYYFVLVSRISIWLEADDNYFPGKQRATSQMMRKNLMR